MYKKVNAMEKKLKTAFILMCLPAILNLSLSGYLHSIPGGTLDFQGYLLGTILSILLSFFWIWQVKKSMASNPMVMLKVIFFGFTLKLAVLGLFVYGGYHVITFNRSYFAVAFLLGILFTVFIELWLYVSVIREKRA
ncbi:MAG: hypothetical protein CVV44_12445 [Spirochaetae bacterium HGW-Spirochaetae-1]|jgi:hypothetical protein|nr:MAG: hypothetical protein CVV44_12445 [Spirochaetae bacterium HGW-Spirochaetae-1]